MIALIRASLCAVLLAFATQARAGFFIPKDTTMVMGMHSPDTQSFEIARGLSRDLSLSAGYHRYKSDDRQKDRRYTILQASVLLDRRAHADGISNIYLFGGPILARSNELVDDRSGLQAGLWGDYETRRIYLRTSAQTHRAGAIRQTVVTAQGLWAPYAADYEDVASWIGIQLQQRHGLSDTTQVTPMLRFFQRNWWIDAGISTNRQHRGELFINAMFLY